MVWKLLSLFLFFTGRPFFWWSEIRVPLLYLDIVLMARLCDLFLFWHNLVRFLLLCKLLFVFFFFPTPSLVWWSKTGDPLFYIDTDCEILWLSLFFVLLADCCLHNLVEIFIIMNICCLSCVLMLKYWRHDVMMIWALVMIDVGVLRDDVHIDNDKISES